MGLKPAKTCDWRRTNTMFLNCSICIMKKMLSQFIFFLPLVCSVAWAHHVPSLSPSFAWPVCLSIWFSHHSITFSSDSADNAFDSPMRLNSTRLIIIKWQWWWFFFAIFLFFCVAAAADAILFGSVRFSLSAVFAFSRQYASWMMSLKFVSRTLISISTLYVHKK